MAAALSPPPLDTPIVELGTGLGIVTGAMTRDFSEYLRVRDTRLSSAAYSPRSSAVTLTAQTASIGSTTLLPLATGLYRVCWRFRLSTAATTSSSVLLTITATDGVPVTYVSAAYTGNVTTAPQSGMFLVRADAGTPLSYSTTYASSGATAAVYELDITLEAL